MAAPSETVLPPEWDHVLQQVEKALAQTLEEVAQREQALDAVVPSAAPEPVPEARWRQALDGLNERLRQFHACGQQAEDRAADADAALGAAEQAIQAWLANAAVLRQKLANTGSVRVS